MQLKTYQQQALDALTTFLTKSRFYGSAMAFEQVTESGTAGNYKKPYQPILGLEETPYACIRIPTGGGKTLLAAHSIRIAAKHYLDVEYPLTLWLAPTSTICQQTVDALKNPRHPYRQALDALFNGHVRVFDIEEFTHLRPHDLTQNACIVVGTIQTLRISDTEDRKVYAHHEDLEPHFSTVNPNAPGLERVTATEGFEAQFNGQIKYSFANLLYLHQPLLVIDEAHKAVTDLSREMQQRIRPRCIIEFTATPKPDSNILVNVPASVLKAEQMIKLPVVLSEHPSWQQAINGAIQQQLELKKLAAQDPRYIRPIILFQAQKKNQEVTVDVLRQHLIDHENIHPDSIAIATGDQRELDGINLFDPQCPIEHVITVEALKEGWDCSFAYVFCSVANIRSSTAVEQLLGRVLRMPYAERRAIESLNRSYAHLSEPEFSKAAQTLTEKLVSMGFDEQEAMENVVQIPVFPKPVSSDVSGTMFDTAPPKETITLPSFEIERIPEADREKLQVEKQPDDTVKVTVSDEVGEDTLEAITKQAPADQKAAVKNTLKWYNAKARQHKSPASRGMPFKVPQLVVFKQGELFPPDEELFLGHGSWQLDRFEARLEPHEFTVIEEANTFLIDLNGEKLHLTRDDHSQQLTLSHTDSRWTETGFCRWLDTETRAPDIPQTQLLPFIGRIVRQLLTEQGYTLATLSRCKYQLKLAIQRKLADYRKQAAQQGYQQALFSNQERVETTFDYAFTFDPAIYPVNETYTGRYQFQKHYYPKVGAFDGASEEMACAMALDCLPEVKHWVRNIARQPEHSFSLPTATGCFYPDFVAELTDGRRLVVEYKGAHLLGSDDTQEKRLIGDLWEAKSNGKGLFLVAEKVKDGKDVATQLREKIAS
jgi:type III restriction enzyme